MSQEAELQIVDDVIWIKHIRNGEALQAWLADVPGDALVDLEIDGWRASWLKMSDGPDGRPTPGLKPHRHAKRRWGEMRNDRGRWVTVRLCDDA